MTDPAASTALARQFDVGVVRFGSGSCAVAFELDQAEADRRAAVRLGAVTDRGVLHALFELPAYEWVPLNVLTAAHQSFLRNASEGIVEVRGEMVRRIWGPCGTILAVVPLVDGPLAGARVLSGVPAVYPRWLVCRSAAVLGRAERSANRARAGLVYAPRSCRPTLVVEPRVIVGAPGVYRWWVLEHAYASIRDHRGAARLDVLRAVLPAGPGPVLGPVLGP